MNSTLTCEAFHERVMQRKTSLRGHGRMAPKGIANKKKQFKTQWLSKWGGFLRNSFHRSWYPKETQANKSFGFGASSLVTVTEAGVLPGSGFRKHSTQPFCTDRTRLMNMTNTGTQRHAPEDEVDAAEDASGICKACLHVG
jgi:hypothetical protein